MQATGTTIQAGSEPVLKMGGAGDPPASVGDTPSRTGASNVEKRSCPLAWTVAPVPSGESPDGTGGSPVLPANHFSETLSVPIPGIFHAHHVALKNGLSTSVTEVGGATDNQDGFLQLCCEPKAGSTSAADWIEEIKEVWARGPASTLELARLICLIRKQLARGQWTALWRSGEMPFGRSKGCHLRVIGQGLGWANVRVCARLPEGSRILYHLARLNRKTLEWLIEEEVIRPTLKLWEARQLAAQYRGDTIKTRSIRAVLRERLRRLAEYFAANLADFSAEDLDLAEAQLTPVMQQIGAAKTAILDGNGKPSTSITQLGLLTGQQITHLNHQ
jgi:hypothetical protein